VKTRQVGRNWCEVPQSAASDLSQTKLEFAVTGVRFGVRAVDGMRHGQLN